MKDAYLRSMSGIDDMIYNRQRQIENIRYAITSGNEHAHYNFWQPAAVTKFGLKLMAEIKKLQAIRSELYLIVTYNL